MTVAAVAHTELHDRAAGEALGRQISHELGGALPDAVIVFASPSNNYPALLRALAEATGTALLVGCSSAGEFTSDVAGEGLTCAVAIRAPEMRFSASLARGLSASASSAASALAAGFQPAGATDYRYRSALLLVDALAGCAEDLVEQLTFRTGGAYQFFGGGAGDGARFQETYVFCGMEAHTDAAVALEMLSNKPIGIGARHGWTPAGAPLRVTEAHGKRLVSLNAAPAAEAFEEHSEVTGQSFDRAEPVPFFLHNVLGVRTGTGHKLRVPLGVEAEGGVFCAAEVPAGATAQIMTASGASAAEAAASAARDALHQLEGHRPGVVLFFDCVATRLRLGREFGAELASLEGELGTARYAGFNTYGQIVRAEGQFSGFHNCTAVVCAIPE